MGFTSTVPTTKAYLVERWSGKKLDGRTDSETFEGLTAITSRDDVRVSWGNPHPDALPNVLVLLDDTREYALEPVAAGSQFNERYILTGVISAVAAPRESRLDVWSIVYGIWAEILSDLYEMNRDADLPTGVNVIQPQASGDSDAIASDVYEATISFELAVTARMTYVAV